MYFGSHDMPLLVAIAALAAGALILLQLSFGHHIDHAFAHVDDKLRAWSRKRRNLAQDASDKDDSNTQEEPGEGVDSDVRDGLIIIAAVVAVSVSLTWWLRGGTVT